MSSHPLAKCEILDDRDQVAERLANWFTESDQAAAFALGQQDPPWQFAAEDAVLDREVVDLMKEISVGRMTDREHAQQRWGVFGIGKILVWEDGWDFRTPGKAPNRPGSVLVARNVAPRTMINGDNW